MQIPGVPQVLLEAIAAAQQAVAPGAPVALVGGAVRDVLLHQVHKDPWRGLLDLDLVVEGSGAALVAGAWRPRPTTRTGVCAAEACGVAA